MLVLSVVLYLTALVLAALYLRHKKAGLFDPASLFLAFFTLFTLPLPLRLCFTDEVPPDDFSAQIPLLAPYVPWAVLFCAAGLPFFLLAYYSPLAASIAKRIPVPQPPKLRRYWPFPAFSKTRAAAVLICGIAFLMLWKLGEGNLLNFILLGYNSTEAMIGKGYLAVGIPWLFVGSMFFLYRYANRRTRSDLWIFMALFAAQLLMMFILAARHSILLFVLALTVFWHFAIKRIRFKRLAAIGLLGFISLNLLGYMRGSDYKSLGDFIASTSQNSSNVAEKHSWFYTFTEGEFIVPFQTLPQIIRKFGSHEVPCMWGLTYLEAPVGFIPQAILPSRPKALTNWYMDVYFGGGWLQNQGAAFFFLAEGYLNFGPIGVLLAMAFWGIMLGVLQNYRTLNQGNHGVVLLYTVTLAFILCECIASESRAVLVGLLINVLGITVIGLMIAGGFKRPASVRPRSVLSETGPPGAALAGAS
jgi:oligosaccharide repeat unit polymerase